MSDKHMSTGLSLCEVLQVIFVVLKLVKVIRWSWWIVFLPTLIPLGFLLVGFIIIGMIHFFKLPQDFDI